MGANRLTLWRGRHSVATPSRFVEAVRMWMGKVTRISVDQDSWKLSLADLNNSVLSLADNEAGVGAARDSTTAQRADERL